MPNAGGNRIPRNQDAIIAEVLATVKWWQGLSSDDRWVALESFAVRFSYHSGVIENPRITYFDTAEIFAHDRVSGYTGDLRTLFEIRNLKRAWQWMLAECQHNAPLTIASVLKAHRLLTADTYDARRWDLGERPGAFKLHDFVVGLNETGYPSETVSDAVTMLVNEVAPTLANLSALLENASDDETLTKAINGVVTMVAYFHCLFLFIHPFADGNGRTARLLSNLLFVEAGLPPVIFNDDDRLAYFGALEAYDSNEDLQPMQEFLRVELVKTWQRARARNSSPS